MERQIEPMADTVRDACMRLGIGRTRLYRELNEGRLIAQKVGRKTLIPRTSQEQWLAALPTAAICGAGA